ncbi:MAG: CsgG/HfaB family protein [Gemmatimonadaceae bacterium]
MFRTLSHASRSLAVAALVAAPAVSMAQADNRPVVVVFTFTNSSIGPARADFDGISTGVQDLLITDLASNTKVRLVDRAHIADIMAEQKMSKDQLVDPTTAARLGKILGAQYAITGGFMSDGKGKAVMTGRTIDIETTQIANPQKIEGKSDDVLGMIAQLSSKLEGGMNLATKPGRKVGDAGDATTSKPGEPAKSGSAVQSGTPAGAVGASQYAKAVPQSVIDKSNKSKLEPADMKTYSSALDEMDKRNNTKAKALLTQIHNKYPDFEPANRNLAKLGA